MRVFLSDEGVFLSLNGKKGKPIEKKDKKKKISFQPISAVRIRRLRLTLYAGGAPNDLSLTLGMINVTINSFLSYLKSIGRLDQCEVKVLPTYTTTGATVNFSIRLFTSLAMLAGAFTHTKEGVKDEK